MPGTLLEDAMVESPEELLVAKTMPMAVHGWAILNILKDVHVQSQFGLCHTSFGSISWFNRYMYMVFYFFEKGTCRIMYGKLLSWKGLAVVRALEAGDYVHIESPWFVSSVFQFHSDRRFVYRDPHLKINTWWSQAS